MPKFIRIILCIAICCALVGCSTEKAVENTSIAATQSESSSAHKTSEKTDEIKSSTKKATTEKRTVKKESTTKRIAETKKLTTASTTAKATTKTQETKSTLTTSTKKITTNKSTTNKPATNKATTQKATTKKETTQSSYYCTVSVDCSVISDNMNNLKAGHEDYFTNGGKFLSNYSVKLNEGESAYDALSKACSDNGLSLNVKSDIYGKYIVGINNIDEKDCGPRSGWTYTVNGDYPPKSCDKYKINQNDKIVFLYTCS